MTNEDTIRERAASNRAATEGTTSLATYDTDHGEVTLTPAIIKQYLVSGGGNVSDQEVVLFLNICRYQRLNPFLREAYLIKYGSQPAAIVTGKDVFTKRAAKNPLFDGFEAGLTLKTSDGGVQRREGALVLDGETIIGGWARVFLKGQRAPIFAEASWKEYARYKADGTLQSTWKTLGATMMRKVALVQALREAFPEDFQGLYSQEEMPVDVAALPSEAVKSEAVLTLDAPDDAPLAPDEVLTAEGEVIEDSGVDESDEGEDDSEEVDYADLDLKALAAIEMPSGRHGPKPEKGKPNGSTLGHIVKTDIEYAKWYIDHAKNKGLKVAFDRLVDAWEHRAVATVSDEDTAPDADNSKAAQDDEPLPVGGALADLIAEGAEVIDTESEQA